MNPGQQLHRSLTLWAGLLIILFTLWAWRDSCRHVSTLRGGRGTAESVVNGLSIIRRYDLDSDWGVQRTRLPVNLSNSLWKADHFPGLMLVHHQSNQNDVFLDMSVLKDAMQSFINRTHPGSWALFIPYWLVLLTIILTWTALLIFRSHRRQRAITLPPNEAAS